MNHYLINYSVEGSPYPPQVVQAATKGEAISNLRHSIQKGLRDTFTILKVEPIDFQPARSFYKVGDKVRLNPEILFPNEIWNRLRYFEEVAVIKEVYGKENLFEYGLEWPESPYLTNSAGNAVDFIPVEDCEVRVQYLASGGDWSDDNTFWTNGTKRFATWAEAFDAVVEHTSKYHNRKLFNVVMGSLSFYAFAGQLLDAAPKDKVVHLLTGGW